MLAIHCSLAHAGVWRGVGEALGDLCTTTAYDLPMHGRSAPWDGTGDIHDIATEMGRSLLKAPMDVIGHSFGATVALRLAIETPALVRSVTLIEPVYFAAALADGLVSKEGFASANPGFEAALEAGDMMEAARAFNRGWGDGTGWDRIPQAKRQYMAERIHFVPASTAALHDDSAGLLRPGRFAQATMPALLLEGSTSPPAMGAILDSIERRLPNVTRAKVAGAGHMAPLTHPAEVAAKVRRLLARVPVSEVV